MMKVYECVEIKKLSIQDHFEKNKDAVKVTLSDMLVRIAATKLKFDFSEALKQARSDEFRDLKIY